MVSIQCALAWFGMVVVMVKLTGNAMQKDARMWSPANANTCKNEQNTPRTLMKIVCIQQHEAKTRAKRINQSSLHTERNHVKPTYIQVVPGRAGGGSFRRKKKYIAKKEFAYRMFARRPTIFFGVNEAFAVAWL